MALRELQNERNNYDVYLACNQAQAARSHRGDIRQAKLGLPPNGQTSEGISIIADFTSSTRLNIYIM